MILSSKERIEALLVYLKKSKNAVGISIGDKNGMRLTHVVSGRNEISEKLAKDIIETYPNINYEWLLYGTGLMLKNGDQNSTSIDQDNQKSDNEIINKNGNRFRQLADGSFSLEVKVVPFSAHARYVSEYSDTDAELFGEWEKVTFIVDKVGRGNYLGFRIKGDSMNGNNIMDTPDKAIVLGRELGRHHWKDDFKMTDHGWIIITKDNMLFKDIVGLNKEDGTIMCHSRNPSPEYSDFPYPLNDVLQIFKVIKRTF